MCSETSYLVSPRSCASLFMFFFFFNDTATTEIYTLSLHDALPISISISAPRNAGGSGCFSGRPSSWASHPAGGRDRKSTRLNSSHLVISYAVFCLKKKKKIAAGTSYSRRVDTVTSEAYRLQHKWPS